VEKFYVRLHEGVDQNEFLETHPEINVSSHLENIPGLFVALLNKVEEILKYEEVLSAVSTKVDNKYVKCSIDTPTDITLQWTAKYPSTQFPGRNYGNMGHIWHSNIGGSTAYGSSLRDTSDVVAIPYSSYWTGKNVDIIILEPVNTSAYESGTKTLTPGTDCVPLSHPTFDDLDNPGTSRHIRVDWNLYDSGLVATDPCIRQASLQTGDQTANFSHGGGCASTAGGIESGFAKKSKLYALNFGGNNTLLECLNAIANWHIAKPINPETGYKNPTIINNSWGPLPGHVGFVNFNNVTSIVNNGVTTNRPVGGWNRDYSAFFAAGIIPASFVDNTDQALIEGFYFSRQNANSFESQTAREIAFENLFDNHGILSIWAAGNNSVVTGNEDTDSNYYVTFENGEGNYVRQNNISNYNWYPEPDDLTNVLAGGWTNDTDRIYYHRWSGSPSYEIAQNKRLCVGALSPTNNRRLVEGYSARGPAVDIWATGTSNWSSAMKSGPFADGYKWGMHGGTSSAAPMVTGITACLAEYFFHKYNRWPDGSELRTLVLDTALDDQIEDTSYADEQFSWANPPYPFSPKMNEYIPFVDNFDYYAYEFPGRAPQTSGTYLSLYYVSSLRLEATDGNTFIPTSTGIPGGSWLADPIYSESYQFRSWHLGNATNKIAFLPDEIRLEGNPAPAGPNPPEGTNPDSGPGRSRVRGSGTKIKQGITLTFKN